MNECNEDTLMHSVMKNMPFNLNCEEAKDLTSAKKCTIPDKKMISASSFDIQSAYLISRKQKDKQIGK